MKTKTMDGSEDDIPDAKRIRRSYNLSQNQFAAMLGISLATLRNWEQGRRKPEGPARVLLQVAAKHPNAVWDVSGIFTEEE